ncbi:hypothetical protein PQR75_12015 [Paraburkholderia fungorum]|jgi:hypothetical protein|uniref:hypothetical protein n=1 Tax=Paraburkholderia fungorum TaxID=134537 RepID=UPI0038BAE48E
MIDKTHACLLFLYPPAADFDCTALLRGERGPGSSTQPVAGKWNGRANFKSTGGIKPVHCFYEKNADIA